MSRRRTFSHGSALRSLSRRDPRTEWRRRNASSALVRGASASASHASSASSGPHTRLAGLAFARAPAEIDASAIARNISSNTFVPAEAAMIEGPDIASWVDASKRRSPARCASMLEPPKQLRPSTAAIGAPASAANSASR